MSIAESEDYEVVREGKGTPFARQYEARHAGYPGLVLVEILSEAPRSGARLTAFEREVVTLSLLGHPCVLEAADLAAMPDGTPVVVSPLPEGVGLAQWLDERRPLSAGDALDVLVGVAEALTMAHERGLSHGCVCAENVFMAADDRGGAGTPKLYGFRQRRLCTGKSNGDNSRAQDVRALARLAEQLLTPPELRTANGPRQEPLNRSYGTAAAVTSIISRAEDGGFASPLALVEALGSAVRGDGKPAARVTDSAIIRVETALMCRPEAPLRPAQHRRAPLAVGMLAGSAVALLAMVALRAPLSHSGLVDQGPPSEEGVELTTRPSPVNPNEVPELAAVPSAAAQVAATQPADLLTSPPSPPAPPPDPAPIGDVAAVAPAPPAPVAAVTPRAQEAVPANTLPPQPVGAVAALGVNPHRTASTPRRGVVWSDREHRLVSVDDSGIPTPAPAGEPSAVTPPPLTAP